MQPYKIINCYETKRKTYRNNILPAMYYIAKIYCKSLTTHFFNIRMFNRRQNLKKGDLPNSCILLPLNCATESVEHIKSSKIQSKWGQGRCFSVEVLRTWTTALWTVHFNVISFLISFLVEC